MTTEKLTSTDQAVIGPAAISFPSLYQPNKMSGRYEADILFESGSEVHKQLLALEKQAIEMRWPNGAPKDLIRVVKKGDDKQNPTEGYKGMLYTKVRTNSAPGVTGPDNKDITDPRDIRGGNICIFAISGFAYDNTTYNSRGVWLSLYAVRKLRDGEVLGGSPVASQDLAAYDADTGADEDF